MSRHLRVALYCGFAFLATSCLARESFDGTESRSQNNNAAPGEVPFRLYRGYLIVAEGSLGGEKMNLLIDTGTDPSVLDRRVAQKLRLPGSTARLSLVNRTVEVQQVTLPELRLGPLRAQSLRVLVRDLGFLSRALGIGIDAVIGLDVLRGSSFTIDYKATKIVFGPPQSLTASMPFETGPPFITVRIQIEGEPIRVLLDTGSSGLALFRHRSSSRLGRLQIVAEKKSLNMGGEVRREQVLLSAIQLGSAQLRRVNAFVVDDQEDTGRDFDGLLGPAALGMTRISFDLKRGIFFWKSSR